MLSRTILKSPKWNENVFQHVSYLTRRSEVEWRRAFSLFRKSERNNVVDDGAKRAQPDEPSKTLGQT
jgi:hypothetical protein